MRKILMTLAAVLCCAMTTSVFTARGSNDDDNTTKPNDTTPAVAVKGMPKNSSTIHKIV